MIVEKFDFKDFFDPSKRNIKFKRTKKIGQNNYNETIGLGVGAVGIITPLQAITRWTSIQRDLNGKFQRGGGYHIVTAMYIVSQILGKQLSRLFKPTEYYPNYIEENFLRYSIYIIYNNTPSPSILVYIPKNILSEQSSILIHILDEIRNLVKDDISVYISDVEGKTVDRSLILNRNEDYIIIKKFIESHIQDKVEFPYKENIIIDENDVLSNDVKNSLTL